jgi:hypothetical protein
VLRDLRPSLGPQSIDFETGETSYCLPTALPCKHMWPSPSGVSLPPFVVISEERKKIVGQLLDFMAELQPI